MLFLNIPENVQIFILTVGFDQFLGYYSALASDNKKEMIMNGFEMRQNIKIKEYLNRNKPKPHSPLPVDVLL